MNEPRVFSIHDPDTLMQAANVESFPKRLNVFDRDTFLQMRLPERGYVLAPILPEKGLVMLYAKRGVGKTHVALGIAHAVAAGGGFLKWHATKPRRVLHVDGEMPARMLQERLKAIEAGVDCQPERSFLRILPLDSQDLGVSLNLANEDDQKKIEAQLGSAELLVIDNISTLVNGGKENDAESWNAMQAWLLQLRRRGVSVLLVHHAGRGDNARGTSKREDVLDTVIQLKQPDDYNPEEGARFEVHLTKARGVVGSDAAPFEACLSIDDGAAKWTVKDLSDVEADQIIRLKKEGLSIREIEDELGVSKSKVHRILKQMKESGRL